MKAEQVVEATIAAIENEDAAALAAIKRRLQQETKLLAKWLGATCSGPAYLETSQTWFVHLTFKGSPEPVYLQASGPFWTALLAEVKSAKARARGEKHGRDAAGDTAASRREAG